jgi:hypothetical protein
MSRHVGLKMFVADKTNSKNVFGGNWDESGFISVCKRYIGNDNIHSRGYGAIYKSILTDTLYDSQSLPSPILNEIYS